MTQVGSLNDACSVYLHLMLSYHFSFQSLLTRKVHCALSDCSPTFFTVTCLRVGSVTSESNGMKAYTAKWARLYATTEMVHHAQRWVPCGMPVRASMPVVLDCR